MTELLTTKEAAKILGMEWLEFRENPPPGIEHVLGEGNVIKWRRTDIEALANKRKPQQTLSVEARRAAMMASGPTQRARIEVDYSPYEVHPLADVFPLIEGEKFDELVADIKAHGQRDPIMLTHDGKQIADGRNRWHACQVAEVEPKLERLDPGASVVDYIVSKNLHRRHLDSGQRGVLMAHAMSHLEAEAKARQVKAGKLFGKGKEQVSLNSGQAVAAGRSAAQAADMAGVSRDTINKGKAVAQARPDLAQQVISGQVSLNAAYKATKGHPVTGKRKERRTVGKMATELFIAQSRAQAFEAKLKDAPTTGLSPQDAKLLEEAKVIRQAIGGEEWYELYEECKSKPTSRISGK